MVSETFRSGKTMHPWIYFGFSFSTRLQTITLDCEAMPVLQIKTFRQKSGKVETSHYKATVSRLRARLAIALSYNTLKGDMRAEGFPDVSFVPFVCNCRALSFDLIFFLSQRFALLSIVSVLSKL